MRWKPIVLLEQLPKPKVATETECLDFKHKDIKDVTKMALSIAAFANHIGGTIFYGASEKNAVLQKYVPLTDEEAEGCIKKLNQAQDKLHPRPSATPSSIHIEGGLVVVANVHPSTSFVAVDRTSEGKGWQFPIRVGRDTSFLKFQDVERRMTTERRVSLMLQPILDIQEREPGKEAVQLFDDAGGPWVCAITEIKEFHFKIQISGHEVNIPLSAVQAVWPITDEDTYAVALVGRTRAPHGEVWRYRPREAPRPRGWDVTPDGSRYND